MSGARQAEIEQLVARGWTNSEIGRALGVSAKTIEYHLTRIYDRLGISNRRQLRDLVQQHQPEPLPDET